MKLKKVWHDAYTTYRIDRTTNAGEVHKWFYNQSFDSEAAAQKFIDNRKPSYRGKLSIHPVKVDAGYSYVGTINF
jgi:hypothetical protein